ncbi:hypothetical protein [Flavobacterium sp.]|uniref:hypothetical protein n=1 Tax=Flavobacterium sp. TaxID=239 RepID=UPI00261A7F06|nr:hypothetical protein [Flavobacterium sp.]
MTDELKTAIERLYATFSCYPANGTMEGCPCCVSATDKEKIHTKPLRQLDGEDLSRYAFKALTTWGNTDDFKHYLPRIFELLSTTDFIVDTFVVLGKLNYAKWKTWPAEEQKAINAFLMAWWIDSIKHQNYFNNDLFIEIYKLFEVINPLLDNWRITFDNNSFKNLIDLLDSYYYDLIKISRKSEGLDQAAIATLQMWLINKQELLEQGFFYYETIDKEFAERISNALYIIEHSI